MQKNERLTMYQNTRFTYLRDSLCPERVMTIARRPVDENMNEFLVAVAINRVDDLQKPKIDENGFLKNKFYVVDQFSRAEGRNETLDRLDRQEEFFYRIKVSQGPHRMINIIRYLSQCDLPQNMLNILRTELVWNDGSYPLYTIDFCKKGQKNKEKTVKHTQSGHLSIFQTILNFFKKK